MNIFNTFELSFSDLFCASGKAKLSKKFAVVYFPGIAILQLFTSSFEIALFEINNVLFLNSEPIY